MRATRIHPTMLATMSLLGLATMPVLAQDAGSAPATAEPATAEPATAQPADTAAGEVQKALEDLDLGAGTAVVTVGDERYEFTLEGTSTSGSTTYVGICREIFGMIQANGYATDGRDVTVGMEIPPTDWEAFTDDRYDAPRVEVEDNEANASWVADEASMFVEGSGVDDFEQADGSAVGTARFTNQWAPDSQPVAGSFEVNCETD